MATMPAAVATALKQMHYEEVAAPEPGEVLIRVAACGIGLTVLNCIRGDLAKEWSVASDGLTYTFEIHDNVKFQDGEQITDRQQRDDDHAAREYVVSRVFVRCHVTLVHVPRKDGHVRVQDGIQRGHGGRRRARKYDAGQPGWRVLK